MKKSTWWTLWSTRLKKSLDKTLLLARISCVNHHLFTPAKHLFILIFCFGFILKKIVTKGFWYNILISKMKRKLLSIFVTIHWLNWFSKDLFSGRVHNVIFSTCLSYFITVFTTKIFLSTLVTNFIRMGSLCEGLEWGLMERQHFWP